MFWHPDLSSSPDPNPTPRKSQPRLCSAHPQGRCEHHPQTMRVCVVLWGRHHSNSSGMTSQERELATQQHYYPILTRALLFYNCTASHIHTLRFYSANHVALSSSSPDSVFEPTRVSCLLSTSTTTRHPPLQTPSYHPTPQPTKAPQHTVSLEPPDARAVLPHASRPSRCSSSCTTNWHYQLHRIHHIYHLKLTGGGF